MLSLFAKIYYGMRFCFVFLASPKSLNKDFARREFILNVLLLSSILLSFTATVSAAFGQLNGNSPKGSFIEVFIIFLIFLSGYLLSRAGKSQWVAYGMVFLYIFITITSSFRWGGDVPEDLLIFSFIIIMTGILISSRFSFTVSGIISILLFIIIYLQSKHLITVDTSWRKNPPIPSDAIVYDVTLIIIALVSWLFNREMEKALKRAKDSEIALQKQNDHLEILVEDRTQELRQTQIEKLTQLYRFVEFGRSASGLFHDLVTPLNIVSLNLDKLSEKNTKIKEREMKMLINASTKNVKRLENFVLAARKQLQNQDDLQLFSLRHEIMQVVNILNYKIRVSHIHISILGKKHMKTFNNPIKFSQLMMNLITNAIDAYEESTRKVKEITIAIKEEKGNAVITIQDWGSGINPEHISKIFKPLFTTKNYEKGTGIGLAICQTIIQKSFKGTLGVQSQLHKGTTFTIRFPIEKPPSGKIKREKKITVF